MGIQAGREHGRSRLGTAIGGLQAQIWISGVTIRAGWGGLACMRFSANNGCEAADAAWMMGSVGEWMGVWQKWMRWVAWMCLGEWSGSEGGGCDPGLQE